MSPVSVSELTPFLDRWNSKAAQGIHAMGLERIPAFDTGQARGDRAMMTPEWLSRV